MGTVYRAHDAVLDRQVAIKVLSAAGLGTEGRERMLREAQSIARLGHPNIVQVHDAGEIDHIPYVVMELVDGQDLHAAPPQALPDIIGVAVQICAALEHAHNHGIVHRDLKPENVIVDAEGTAKLVDFGIARSMASRLTGEGRITGSVYYLAPELALGQEFDGRCDLYALGVMLYELSAGTLPFTGSDPLTVISQHVHATPVPPQAKNPAIPPRLDDLILRLLSKRPEERPESAAAVQQALEDPELLEVGAVADRELAVLRRVARGHFVGRQRELKQARSIWLQAQQGKGQALLISGEPGIGKSRLTRELATQAEIGGGRVLIGECYPEGGVPYGPFSQILRRALRWTNGNGSGLPEFVLADLLSLAPDLRAYYPEVGENPALDPEGQQQRLFESVVTLFSRLTDQTPLFLALEDVHWADSGSLALFRHLARRVKEKRAMVVATYRVELGESRPLQEMLVELNRERLADRLKLSRFDRQATGDLLAAIFEEDITPEFLDGIYTETEGNPFFVEELCKALVEEGKFYFENGRWHRPAMQDLDLPQSVRVAIQSRLAKLPDSVLDVLRMAAVLGHDFDFETLSAALQQAEDPLIEALEAAERSQLIEEVSGERGGTFRFAHALIASTLADDLSGLRRRRMHGQAARTLKSAAPITSRPGISLRRERRPTGGTGVLGQGGGARLALLGSQRGLASLRSGAGACGGRRPHRPVGPHSGCPGSDPFLRRLRTGPGAPGAGDGAGHRSSGVGGTQGESRNPIRRHRERTGLGAAGAGCRLTGSQRPGGGLGERHSLHRALLSQSWPAPARAGVPAASLEDR
jgi:hypothetical protein